MLLRSFRPLHIGWPAWAQAILAPIQGLHLRLLSERTLLPGSAADLESKLRPLLLPHEDWSDTGAWRGNTRLLAWLRSEVILRHPGTQRLLPAAEAELLPAGELPRLPDAAMVRRLFERTRPDGDVRPPARRSETGEAAREAASAATESATGCTRHVSFAEVLHGAGGLVRGRGVLNAFCERHGFYEVLTQELVAALAAHIRARLPALQAAAAVEASCNPAEEGEGEGDGGDEYPVVILEVGAGSGALSFHLREALRGEACEVVACDSGAQALPGAKYPLGEAMLETSHEAALRITRPSMVLCAWMPMGRDLSRAFRRCESVQEYVLLGEADDGACGDTPTLNPNPNPNPNPDPNPNPNPNPDPNPNPHPHSHLTPTLALTLTLTRRVRRQLGDVGQPRIQPRLPRRLRGPRQERRRRGGHGGGRRRRATARPAARRAARGRRLCARRAARAQQVDGLAVRRRGRGRGVPQLCCGFCEATCGGRRGVRGELFFSGRFAITSPWGRTLGSRPQ